MITLPVTSVNRPVYAEGSSMASIRDGRSVSRQWLKNKQDSTQAFSTARTMAKLAQDVQRLKHRIAPSLQDFTETILPFEFYQSTPSATAAINDYGVNYAIGDKVTLSGGTLAAGSAATELTVGSVSADGFVLSLAVTRLGKYTTNPTFPNTVDGGSGSGLTVTMISSSDEFRTVSMRDGLVGIRSRFFGLEGISQNQSISNWWYALNAHTTYGAYETPVYIQCDRVFSHENPPQQIIYTPIMLGAIDEDVLISGFDETSGNFVSYGQIVLNPPTVGQQCFAGLWLEIVDDATKPTPAPHFAHVNLKGRMFSGDGTDDAFPTTTSATNNVNVIPLAIVAITYRLGSTSPILTINQLVSGNLLNLFDSYFNNTVGATSGIAVASKTNWRGDWDGDSLDGQYFYPGDWVTQGTFDIVGGDMSVTTLKSHYLCIKYGQCKNSNNTDPAHNAPPGNWLSLTQ